MEVLAFIILGVAILYGKTLLNGYIHDDHGQVEDNVYIHSLVYLPKAITGCIWESAVGNCKETLYYRPLHTLSYLLTYQISPQPWTFHLVNLIYYGVDIFLVIVLVYLLTRNSLLTFLSAFIFLIHPLNSEVVSWISSVPELLYTMFVLLGTIFYFLYREKENLKYLKFVYIFYLFGILSKEPAVFVPFVFLGLDLIYFKKTIPSLLTWKNIRPYVVCILLFIIYMGLRFWVLGGLGTHNILVVTSIQRIYIFTDLFGSYVTKLLWPSPLSFFYTFHPSYQVFGFHFLAAVLLLLGFGGLFFIAWRKRWRTVLFCLIWFLVFLSPSLVFINSIGENLFAERHVFASTISFSILVAMLLERLWRRQKAIVIGCLVIVGILAGSVIYSRNELWKDDVSIATDALKKNPDADLLRYNLAVIYRDKGETDLAKEEFKKILDRGEWTGIYKAYNNMGDIYRSDKNYDEAARYFKKAIQANPLHRAAYNNLGAMYLERGDIPSSVTFLCKALLIDPSFQPANTNYDYAAATVQKMDDVSFQALYQNVVNGKVFQPSLKKNTIILRSKDCSNPQGCLLVFSAQLQKNEFLFPFLISGQTSSGKLVRMLYTGFDPATNNITLGIDQKFADSKIHFIFPTCDSVYYEVSL